MLASSYSWGAGDKSLTFTIRSGVKFSNGTPLTANDVAYTFNLLKKYPALDLPGVWSVLSSVTATGADQVTMDFSAPAVPWFYYIADQVPIVSQAIWSKIANPVAYPDTHPVGTGPYEVNPCTSANITYTANPNYWQAGEPKVKKIEYPAFTSNNTANDELANGQAQWGAQYIPSIASFYTAKSPDFHYWFPPTVNVSIVPNLTNPLLSNVEGPPGDLLRDQPVAGLLPRRVRLRAPGQPDRHRHPDVLQHARTARWSPRSATPTTRPRPSRCSSRPATS